MSSSNPPAVFVKQTLDRLYSLVDNAKRKEFLKNNREFKLTSINKILEKLANPQKKIKIIHVAGTKGKGSCVHYLSAMFKQKKIRSAHFLSPQILDERDRFYLDHQKSSWGDIIYWFERILNLIEQEKIMATVFDIFTATAFSLFAEKKVEWAIIETGLGGRLDSTNVVDPVLSVITTIGLDHTNLLGENILEIAREKAGIIKQGKPLFFQQRKKTVLTPQEKEEQTKIENLFQQICQQKKSAVFAIDDYHPFFNDISNQKNKKFSELSTQLSTAGQRHNLAICLAIMEHLKTPLTEKEFMIVLSQYPLLGRKQHLANVIIDGAHNEVSLRDLLIYIHTYPKFKNYRQVKFFFYLQPDKNINGFLSLLPLNWQLFFVDLDLPYLSKKSKEQVKTKIKNHQKHGPKVEILPSDYQIPFREHPDTLFIVSGSFLLVGNFWQQQRISQNKN